MRTVLPQGLLSLLALPPDHVPLRHRAAPDMLEATDGRQVPMIDGVPVFLEQPPKSDYSVAAVEVSLLVLTLNEGGNISEVLEDAKLELVRLGVTFEMIVIDGGSTDGTQEIARNAGATVHQQSGRGYAAALREGLNAVSGRFVLTLDGDCSHPASLIPALMHLRHTYDIVVGSRWMAGGSHEGGASRRVLSRALSAVFRRILRLPVHDLSSGYRLYRRDVLSPHSYHCEDFSILQEIIIRAYNEGFRIGETPLRYRERKAGRSHVQLMRFAWSYLRTLVHLAQLRSDEGACDYEHTRSRLSPSARRERARVSGVMQLAGSFRDRGQVLCVGWGSGRVVQGLPHAVVLDESLAKLRYLATSNASRVCGTATALPFVNQSFECIISAASAAGDFESVLREIRRVLQRGGVLIASCTSGAQSTLIAQHAFQIESVRELLDGEVLIRAAAI